MATYAIISLQGKQYRVREGQRLLVDRLPHGERKTFHPRVLFLGGDGTAEYAPKAAEVTARVVQHVLGDKVQIGKYKAKKGYRRHTGHRDRLSEIEVESIGKKRATAKVEPATATAEPATETPKAKAKAEATPKKTSAAKPEASAAKKETE